MIWIKKWGAYCLYMCMCVYMYVIMYLMFWANVIMWVGGGKHCLTGF